MYFPHEEYEDRWSRVYDAIKAEGFETALIWGRSGGTYERYSDVLYLTNYYSSQSGHEYDSEDWMGVSFSAILMSHGDVPQIVADEPDYPEHLLAIPTDRYKWEKNVIRGAAEAIKARGIEGQILHVGTDFLPVKYAQILESELPNIEFVPAEDLVRKVRRFKSARELDCYREVGERASAAMTSLMQSAVRGGTQADAAAAGTAEVVRRGGFPHMVPVSSGPSLFWHCGDPLTGFSSEITMAEGDVVRAWIYGPMWQGYWSDPGRTAVVGGNPTSRQRDLIRAANDIVTRLMDAIRPGVKVMDVVRQGNELREQTGTEDDQPGKMWPIYGHGVGLFWEDPWLVYGMKDDSKEYHVGQTCSTEVFLHWPDVGSAGVEQNFIVGEDSNELLTTTELEWW
jgi:Xaa-Pro aminopeptidase